MKAIILSGGKGTRLKPLTDTIPKPMLPINGTPHLEYIINLLKSHGIVDIIFSTGYLHEKIVNYFGNGKKFGVNIAYREDGEKPLGTAGAIKNCYDLVSDGEDFLVFNGDILTDINLTQLIAERQILNQYYRDTVTIGLVPVKDPTQFGLAIYDDDGRIHRFVEKPSVEEMLQVPPPERLINSGIYVMNRTVLSHIPDNEFSMLEVDIFPKYAYNGNLYMYKEARDTEQQI